MKDTVTLTITSLVTILMLVLHLTIEIVHGVEPGNVSTYVGVLILAAWMFGALPLASGRSGLIIMLLGGIAAAGVSILHMRGAGLAGGRIGQTSDAFLWVSTLLTFGVTGTFSAFLAARALFNRPRK
ncbi:MAG TPA: hypothetical protein VFK57_22475 [Vicinamibacterales bacterium]|nr:hypothetical protein [Vicinamibacterales bacterium]